MMDLWTAWLQGRRLLIDIGYKFLWHLVTWRKYQRLNKATQRPEKARLDMILLTYYLEWI